MPEAKFKKIFEIDHSFKPDDDALNILAEFMAKSAPLKSKTPAGYTYLAQFVDHDISLDSAARTLPWQSIDVPTVFNRRNPAFDLETLYGANAGQTCEFLQPELPFLTVGKTCFDIASTVKREFDRDLPRDAGGLPAIYDARNDGRNDENLLIAQTHVAFIKFHNAVASITSGGSAAEIYQKTRRRTIRHYQHIILHDLLPRIVKKSVLKSIRAGKSRFYGPAVEELFIPLEYAVAAFRMGHSMVRNTYQINALQKANLNSLGLFTGRGGMFGKKRLPSDWLVNWKLFYNLTGWKRPPKNFNFASKINTEISSGLGKFRPAIGFKRDFSIPALDLYRARLFALPTGQMIADRMSLPVVDAARIAELLPEKNKTIFGEETPLWFYLLAEAQIETDGETLGTAGSHIVAETMLRILADSEFSILKEPLAPGGDEFLGRPDGRFGMAEMLNFIESKEKGFLNPVGA